MFAHKATVQEAFCKLLKKAVWWSDCDPSWLFACNITTLWHILTRQPLFRRLWASSSAGCAGKTTQCPAAASAHSFPRVETCTAWKGETCAHSSGTFLLRLPGLTLYQTIAWIATGEAAFTSALQEAFCNCLQCLPIMQSSCKPDLEC